MQKFKNLITALIEAVFGSKKAYIAKQAMPSTQKSIEVSVSTVMKQYTAPSDGFLAVLTEDSNGFAECRNESANYIYSRSNGDSASAYIPMAKGQVANYRQTQNGSGYCYAKFIPLIGGGGLIEFFKRLEVSYVN